jgi:predicted RNase H-like HicB family nuclease
MPGVSSPRHAAGRSDRSAVGEELWAEVLELPGCFAADADMEELREALSEAISLYLSEPGDVKHVELEDEPGSVTEHRMLARTA